MMEVVLNRLRDFSCKTSTFGVECKAAAGAQWRDVRSRDCLRVGCTSREGKLDIQSALDWLRRELLEMRSQDQALIRQLMELHSGIQELKQELSEEEECDDEEDEGSWDSESEHSSSQYSSSGEVGSYLSQTKTPQRFYTRVSTKRAVIRRSSVP